MKPKRIKEKKALKPKVAPKPNTIKDPVEVSCRLRPLANENDTPCVQAISTNEIQLIPPNTSQQIKNGIAKEMQYTFKGVFDEMTTQKQLFENIAKPLVHDLIKGKNGLLFTFGITSSGKTYTMTGSPKDGGILPRSLDTVFNTIAEQQARKYVFKSDKMNGFDIQSNSDAMLDQQKDIVNYHKTPRRLKKDSDLDWSQRLADKTKLNISNSDIAYAVFVSYIEIYNNYVYDLLDDDQMDIQKLKNPQSKILREDGNKNMFVHGVTEIEVKSTDEAFEVFCRGQLRRRVAHTALNTESSRSHSVFNIRLVQAPLDQQGSEVDQDKNKLLVSQLSLVDLAGSERSNRTKNVGDRLREAGNINSSLMSLKNCVEILRDNQFNNANRMVPYRDNKLTHLFRSFFEGVGKIKMIVCVNPRAEDYDETIHVMKFAKLTQEVKVPRQIAPPTPVASNVLAFGRGNRYKEAAKQALEEGIDVQDILSPLIYSLGPLLPEYAYKPLESEDNLNTCIQYLTDRHTKRMLLTEDLKRKEETFRKALQNMEEESRTMKNKLATAQMDLAARELQVKNLEKKLFSLEQQRDSLQKRVGQADRAKQNLENEIEEKDALLSQGEVINNKLKLKFKDKLLEERRRLNALMEMHLKKKQAEIESKMCIPVEKVRMLQEILNCNDDDFQLLEIGGPSTVPDFAATPKYNQYIRPKPSAPPLTPMTPMHSRNRAMTDLKLNLKSINTPGSSRPNFRNQPISNPRHRRSFSADGKWVDHRPKGNVETGTIFQPNMKRKKSVTKLTAKDFTRDSNCERYVLTHQEQDDQGQLETQLIKGDVIPTAGGGAQVVFNDIETLRQNSPENKSTRKRNSGEMLSKEDVENRCAYGVEGRTVNGRYSNKKRRT